MLVRSASLALALVLAGCGARRVDVVHVEVACADRGAPASTRWPRPAVAAPSPPPAPSLEAQMPPALEMPHPPPASSFSARMPPPLEMPSPRLPRSSRLRAPSETVRLVRPVLADRLGRCGELLPESDDATNVDLVIRVDRSGSAELVEVPDSAGAAYAECARRIVATQPFLPTLGGFTLRVPLVYP